MPRKLGYMEIWQTQNRSQSGRAGEIPAISSISLLSNRPQIQASVLKGVAKTLFQSSMDFPFIFLCN
jgi:hypothetical protein